MSLLRTLAVGSVLLAGSGATATAADIFHRAGSLKDTWSQPVHPSVTIKEGASWYLRGDIGYVFNDTPDLSTDDMYLAGISHEMDAVEIDNGYSIGGGIGYYFSHNLRGDLTVDYRESVALRGSVRDNHMRFEADTQNNDGGSPDGSGDGNPNSIDSNNNGIVEYYGNGVYNDDLDGNGIVNSVRKGGIYYDPDNTTGAVKTHIAGNYDFDIQSTLYLANLYYDFKFGYAFRPYVGVGLGFAHHRIKAGQVVDLCGCEGVIESNDDTTFAAAVMVGGTYEWSKGVNIDVGYRYAWLGETTTGVATVRDTRLLGDGWTGTTSVTPKVEDLYTHDLRFGLRYDIW